MHEPALEEKIRLTRYSHGAGCGCKIAPAVLDSILNGSIPSLKDPRILVGYGSRDDAAVIDIGDGRAIISTTDFFSPIVDDAFGFGRVAAVNALSDIYAMGGKPLVAVAILGWPVDKLPAELAAQVIDGGRKACHDAGIGLAGGHSIDAPEPFFGLAVTGEVRTDHIKRNNTAKNGDLLVLTKPLGLGILAAARKRDLLQDEHDEIAMRIMCHANVSGYELGKEPAVHAMTDVTGFGLLGHLIEMCDGSGLAARLDNAAIPIIPGSLEYLRAGCYPDGSFRNWKSYGSRVRGADALEIMMMVSDPQTSGGLLISVDPTHWNHISHQISSYDPSAKVIGKLTNEFDGPIVVSLQ